MARAARVVGARFGVGEWFGNVVAATPGRRKAELSEASTLSVRQAAMPCPFRQSAERGAICNKKGGICSLRSYRSEITADLETRIFADGPFVTVCPSRFWHDNAIFRWIGETVIGTASPILIKEVEFLGALGGGGEAEAGEGAGRIDTILINADDSSEWCAVEMQAVYFSGAGMASHLAQFSAGAEELPFPDAVRRPDFRSSGPKRLMPQLQTKVPTLRRRGKKMVAVVDHQFFGSLGSFVRVPHLSNADIAWFVVDYDLDTAEIRLQDRVFTTLESSVEALTAGLPTSREAFEAEIARILGSDQPAMVKKVIRLPR
jgi:hypothetical protein